MKLVSTILCCHQINNQLFESINSILDQEYNNHELIILFDNPIFEEFEIIKNFYKNHKHNKKILFFQNDKSKGLTFSLNKAINHANGEYIMRQDSDDISETNRMSLLVDYLNANKNKDLVYSNVKLINDNGDIFKLKKNYLIINSFFSSYNYRNSISHPSIMFRKSIINKVGFYDERFKVSQDYEFIHRVIKNSRYSIGKIDSYLYKLRYSPNSISSINSIDQLYNSVVITFMYLFENFNLLFQNAKSDKEMFEIIEKSKKTYKHLSIYYSYLFFKKIPFNLLMNPIFSSNILIRYLFHPNLLIKRIFG